MNSSNRREAFGNASNVRRPSVFLHSQKFRTLSGVTYVATFNAVIGSRLFRKQVTLVPLPTSKLLAENIKVISKYLFHV